jgi:uncharacterized protein (TIGR02001 family)
MRLCLVITALASTLARVGVAQCTDTATTKQLESQGAEPKSAHAFSANVGIASQYVYRGLTQTDGRPAMQGGLDYSHAGGFYVGTWLSNISWFTEQNAGSASAPVELAAPGRLGGPYDSTKRNRAALEWDMYAGYRRTFAADWSVDLGILRYEYPGSFENLGSFRDPHSTEVHAQIGYRWVTLKYSNAVSPHLFGVENSRGATYVDLAATLPIGESGFKIQSHVGRQDFPHDANFALWGSSGGDNAFLSYTDAKVGATLDRWGFTFGAAWTYADSKDLARDRETTAYLNASGKNIGRGRVALTITRAF